MHVVYLTVDERAQFALFETVLAVFLVKRAAEQTFLGVDADLGPGSACHW